MSEDSGSKPLPYAGRWVAHVRGQVIAQGGTPEQARRAAQGSRFKETPEIVYMPTALPLTFSPLLDSVRAALPDDLTVYLVGGAVRDALQGRITHDLDFALSRDGIRTARRVANALKADFYSLDPERDTGRVIITAEDGRRTVMDFTAFRGPNLETDLQGRDFSLNAMAMDVRTLSIYDPLGGALDLKEKRLRACSASTFGDDPVRILRGVRLAAAFGFHIPPETRQAMKDAVSLLPQVSAERLRDELFRILEGPQPATCIRALDVLGALAPILPELPTLKDVVQPAPHLNDVWTHTLGTLNHLESTLAALSPDYNPDTATDLFNGLLVLRIGRYRQQLARHLAAAINVNRSLIGLLFLAALYHDVAKPLSKTTDKEGRLRFWGHDEEGAQMAVERARALQLSNDEVERLRTIVRHHMRVHYQTDRLVKERKQPTRRAIYRFFRDAGVAGVDIVLLALADFRATYEHTLPQDVWTACLDVCRSFLENWWEKPEESVVPPSLVNGKEVMEALGLQPGPQVGELLKAIREAQAMGEVVTREQAMAFAREWMEKNKYSRGTK